MAYAGKAGEPRPPHPRVKSLPRKESRPLAPIATAAAVGLLVGLGAALLFAPHEGTETRRRLKRGAKRAARRGRDAWQDLRAELRSARRRFRRSRGLDRPREDERFG